MDLFVRSLEQLNNIRAGRNVDVFMTKPLHWTQIIEDVEMLLTGRILENLEKCIGPEAHETILNTSVQVCLEKWTPASPNCLDHLPQDRRNDILSHAVYSSLFPQGPHHEKMIKAVEYLSKNAQMTPRHVFFSKDIVLEWGREESYKAEEVCSLFCVAHVSDEDIKKIDNRLKHYKTKNILPPDHASIIEGLIRLHFPERSTGTPSFDFDFTKMDREDSVRLRQMIRIAKIQEEQRKMKKKFYEKTSTRALKI